MLRNPPRKSVESSVALAFFVVFAYGMASADDTAAAVKYDRLMSEAEGKGRRCMLAEVSKDEAFDALKEFGAKVEFVDLDRAKPIKVILPEGYYHPAGRTVVFDEFALAINSQDPSRPYISMTKTADGLKLEPKFAIEMENGRIVCVRSLSATVEFDSNK